MLECVKAEQSFVILSAKEERKDVASSAGELEKGRGEGDFRVRSESSAAQSFLGWLREVEIKERK